MTELDPTHSLSLQRSLVQTKNKILSVSGNSVRIHKGDDTERVKEKQIFRKSIIRFLLPIGEKSEEKGFFLAISSKRIALFNLKKNFPIVTFKVGDKIVDHGRVKVLSIGRKEEEDGAGFRVRLVIPLVFRSGTMKNMRITATFLESQIIDQKLKCLEEMEMDGEGLRMCVPLGTNAFFGVYEDTVVKADGTVTRAGEPSLKKKRRIAIIGRDLWQGNVLMATENGSIRVVRVKDEGNKERDSIRTISEGQCVPPYCTLRCRQPSVIISTENTVIVGTERGEIHCLNERLELIRKIEMEGGPINCLKVDDNDANLLWIGFGSGKLRRATWASIVHNDLSTYDADNIANFLDEEQMEESNCESNTKRNKRRGPIKDYGKRSETEMECLEMGCGFKTRVASTFVSHLRTRHRTIPSLAGIVLRCQCGVETMSKFHSQMCNISNFTVIRKNDFGPTRTLADMMIPQCTLCKMYPRSVYGYAHHLYLVHQKSLDEIGCCLKCGVCGGDFYNYSQSKAHSNKCKSRFYRLLKLGEERKNGENNEDKDGTGSVFSPFVKTSYDNLHYARPSNLH